MKPWDVLVIGAGSVGVPLAYHLARSGATVLVLERHPSVGCGANKAAIGGVRATHSDPVKIDLCLSSLDFIRRLEPEYGCDVDYVQGGYLFPVYDETTERSLKALLVIQKQHDLAIDWVTPEEVRRLAPGINPRELRGGTYSPRDGHLSPLKLIHAFHKLARKAGAEFRFGETVRRFVVRKNRIVAVVTDKGEYSTSMVVNAAGPQARELGCLGGLELAVHPELHEAGISDPVQRFFDPLIVDIRPASDSDNFYFYQNREGQVVFCITPRPKQPGFDTSSTSAFLPMVVPRMLELYPRLRHLKIRRTWRGIYPMTPDSRPMVGFAREVEGFCLATGMCGQGLMLGPGLGKTLAHILLQGPTEANHQRLLSELSPYRAFGKAEVLK